MHMNKDITLLQKAGVFALVCVGILSLTGVYSLYKSTSNQNMKTFAVQGTGDVEVTPTKATIMADFYGEGQTSEEAKKALTDQTVKVFAELEKLGVKKEKIKTQNVSANPKYEYCYSYPMNSYPAWCKNNPSQNRVVGHEAFQNFTITINDDKEMVEKVLGLFPSLGARNMNGPNWEVDNKQAVQQAREKAVEEARVKAEGIAKSLGMRLGEPVYYSEDQGGGGYPVPMMYNTMSARSDMKMEAAGIVPVAQGTDKVTVNVNITYELK